MKDKLLKSFMKEFFPFSAFRKIGFFDKKIKGDYEAQAKRVCEFFGYKSVYEYRSKTVRCHLSFCGDRPLHIDESGELKPEAFITEVKSIYEE